MQIAGLQKNSTVDFPGQLSAVVFLPGCNYSCYYCHNSDLLAQPPLLSQAEVLAFLKKRQGLLDGVVISGGEPTLQADLPKLIATIKDLGYAIKLDTNGSNPQVVERLLHRGLLDYVALDYKAPFDLYAQITGCDYRGVFQTLQILRQSQVPFELRTTLIPQITRERLEQMAKEVPRLPLWALQVYRPQPGYEKHHQKEDIYSPMAIAELAEQIRLWQPNVITRI